SPTGLSSQRSEDKRNEFPGSCLVVRVLLAELIGEHPLFHCDPSHVSSEHHTEDEHGGDDITRCDARTHEENNVPQVSWMTNTPINAIRDHMMSFSYLERPCKELSECLHSDHTKDNARCHEHNTNGSENKMRFNDADLELVEKGSEKQNNHKDNADNLYES